MGSIFVVVTILPWDSAGMAQPYVSALQELHIPGAAQIMNAVILTAVLSALNSGLFGSSRMLLAMAQRGDAPRGLGRLNSRGVPSSCDSDWNRVWVLFGRHELRVARGGVRVPRDS